jgi:hypothetical protein
MDWIGLAYEALTARRCPPADGRLPPCQLGTSRSLKANGAPSRSSTSSVEAMVGDGLGDAA